MKRKPKSSENDKINSLTWEWFVSSRENNEPISGLMIQAKALQIAEQLSITKFKASNGWLESFKTRHNICRNKMYQQSKKTGDVLHVDKPEVKLKLLLEDYELKNIYNGVETGLLFRALPSQTLPDMSEECNNGELSNERLTMFLCVNMEGEFEKTLIIGKAKTPRCFKNLDLKTLPIIWRSNNKAWITSSLMDEWLLQFNYKMKLEHRKVILLLHHAKFQPCPNYSNVHIVLLPAYTSFTQPMSQGIIYSVKYNYRKMVLQSLLASVDDISNVEKLANNITELDAIYWLSKSIKLIKPDAVKKCFIKTGFKSVVSDEQTDDLLPDDDFEQLCMTINKEVNSQDYLNIDMNLCTSYDEIDDQKEDDDQSGSVNKIINSPPTSCTNDIKTYENALNEIKRLELFSLNQYHHNDLFEAVLKVKYLLENKIVCNKIKKYEIK